VLFAFLEVDYMTRPAAPAGMPDDIWQEILTEDEPDDEGDDALADERRDEQRHDAAEAAAAVLDEEP